MLVSVDIPNTASTSFRDLLQRHFGARLLLDYTDRPLAPGWRWRRLRHAIGRRDPVRIDAAYDCVHGHFVADKYDRLDVPVRCITWLRDPVLRTISHYRFWQRAPDLRNPYCRALIEKRLSIEAFAALPRLRNVATRFFGGKRPQDFFFIGTVETIAASLDRFHRLTGIAVDAAGMGSEGDDVAAVELSAATRGRIDNLNRRDRMLYETTRELLARR